MIPDATSSSSSSTRAPSLDAVRHGRAVIEEGEHGKSVRKLQLLMNDVFDHAHINVDGSFGPARRKNTAGLHGHIAMVRPGHLAGPGNPATAQAGATNFLHGHMRDGFGSNGPVLYFTHD